MAKAKDGGMNMNAQFFWNVFMQTGAPEAYLLYSKAKHGEDVYVPDHQSSGAAGEGIR